MTSHDTKRAQIIENVKVRVLPDGRMTRRDAALYMGLAPKTLAMWAWEKRGPSFEKIAGKTFYRQAVLDAFLAREAAA